MALKLRRQTEVFTNGMLAHRNSDWKAESLGTGADSFKRVLGSELLRVKAPPDNAGKHNAIACGEAHADKRRPQ